VIDDPVDLGLEVMRERPSYTHCSICGIALTWAYLVNGRRLCRICMTPTARADRTLAAELLIDATRRDWL
jgi:hypothetical protein